MASTGAEVAITLADWARTQDPTGSTAAVAELLAQSNELVNYLYWQEANGSTSETVTQRVGLPQIYYRNFNQGVLASKSEYAQITEGMAMADGWSEIDEKLVDLNAQRANFRFLEGLGFVETLTQKFCQQFFYGDPTQDSNNATFFGMAPRYGTISGATNGQNIIDGGGTGSANTSMWLINSGPRSMYGIFPRGSAAGLKREDLGLQTSIITAGLGQQKLRVYQEHFTWDQGIALKDWRWCARIANIDVANLKSQNGATNLIEAMTLASYVIPSISTPASTTGNPLTSIAMTGRQFWVCNRRVRAYLHIQAQNKLNTTLSYEDIDGRKMLTFMGWPILNCDQLLMTEARVV